MALKNHSHQFGGVPNSRDISHVNNSSMQKPLNIKLGTVPELSVQSGDENQKFDVASCQDDRSPRAKTLNIVKQFDQLIKTKLYRIKKPKFEFNDKAVASKFCDTYINEELVNGATGELNNFKATVSPRRGDYSRRSGTNDYMSERGFSTRISNRKTALYKAEEAQKFQLFC